MLCFCSALILLTWVLYSWYRLRVWELPEGKRNPPTPRPAGCWWPARHNISSPLWIKLITTRVNWRSHSGRCVYLRMGCNEELWFYGALLCCLSTGLLKSRKYLSRNAGDKCERFVWFTDCGNTVDSSTASALRDEAELTVASKGPFWYSPAQWIELAFKALSDAIRAFGRHQGIRTPSRHYIAMTLVRTLSTECPFYRVPEPASYGTSRADVRWPALFWSSARTDTVV